MVDRANLIKHLEPHVRPTGSQVENIRSAMDKTLAELLLALPLSAVHDLPATVKTDLVEMILLIEPKTCEKMAAAWEPKRKLDAELKGRLKNDLRALINGRRPVYEPIAISLAEARKGDRSAIKSSLRTGAPLKDLKALTKKWDKNWRPAQETRSAYEDRLTAMLDGAEPTAKKGR